MALSLGKLTILLGAGIAGSVFAKEGRLPDVSGVLSGAWKVATWFKVDSPPTVKKPRNDALMAQVASLQQELQRLGRDGSITIVNASGTGGRKYVTVIVIVVVGYGYIWWKGWKLPDMMFATKRGLSDACTSIGNQLGKVYESIEDAKKKLSAKINRVDKGLDESLSLSKNTREEISVIRSEADAMNGDIKSVHVALHVIESKIQEIEWNQEETNKGVDWLCQRAKTLEKNSRTPEYIQASSSSSSRPSIVELPPDSPSSRGAQSASPWLSLEPPPFTPSRTGSLPPTLSTDPLSLPSPAGSYQSSRISKERNLSNGTEAETPGSSSGLFGLFSNVSASFLSRTRSATDAVVQKTRT
ncbi:uncharacterized protein LOC130718130 isoform X2 [Lotus japonicus]|uniref:uncharacterized protein LOC130718130 isoform X2 n=1 Tax=Lotus japonicus TaxID=34305 RepID=UPI00258A2AAA|nr:uncharacterized protein LOC130718130 isoform X2 [Lotus japonicus]